MINKLTCIYVCTLHFFSLSHEWHINYHNVCQKQFDVAASEVTNFSLIGNEKILDVGCGTGKISHLYAQHVPFGEVIGIDRSITLVEFAQQEYKETENLSFMVQDAQNITFDQEFDIVYSYYCLHWVQDKQKVMCNIARSLKPGGRACICIPAPATMYDFEKELFDHMADSYPAWRPYLHHPTAEDPAVWLSRANNAGLKIIKTSIIEKESLFDSKQAYKQYLCTLGFTSLDEVDKHSFFDAFVTHLYDHYGLQEHEPYMRKTNNLVLHLLK